MKLPLMVAKLMLTDEIEERISVHLNTIINGWDLSLIEIGISLDKVDVSEFKYSQIEKYKIMWCDIAKLSINLMVDYEYYRQFCFESRYSMKEYSERLLNLGFVFENDHWKSVSKPDIKDAQINIFMYFLYRLIFEKMTFNRDNDQNGENEKRYLEETKNDKLESSAGILFFPNLVDRKINVDRCSCCDYEILSKESKYSVCDSTIDEHMNIKGKKPDLNILEKTKFCRCCATIEDIRENSEFRMPVNGKGNNTNMLDVRPENKEDATLVDINKWKCGACGYFNEYKNINCDKCGDLYKDGRWRCVKCLTENSCEFGDCQKCKCGNTNVEDRKNDNGYYGPQDGGERDLSKEDGGLVGNNDFMKEETNIKKWKCGGCELLNEYSVMNCVVCFGLYEDGKWTCGKCNKENSGGDDLCGSCNERNANITVTEGDNKTSNIGVGNNESGGDIPGIVDRDKQTQIPVDKWRCTKCTMVQSYKNTMCEVCGSSSHEFGEWRCAKCTLINKYDNEKCHICGEWNDNFPKKLCHDCNTNRVTGTEVRCEECARNINMPWKCGYIICGSMNKCIDEYCSKCKFWRYNMYGRGDESIQQGQIYGINKGWICYECAHFNDKDKSHCSKSTCNTCRYAKISEVANAGDSGDAKTAVEKGTEA